VFEQCRYRAKLKYIDRVPEPKRPLPPGKSEHANDRGTRIHECAELFVKGGVELIEELHPFKDRLTELRTQFSEGKVELEGEWAFDNEWTPTAWASQTAWCRMKLDVLVNEGDYAKVIDYKTGRKHGNEVKHAEQGQLYQLATFCRYPDVEVVDVEFWYIDQGPDQDMSMSYTREQGTRYIDKYHKRGVAVTSAVEFPPNPNAYSCKWCPYLGGACEFGVKPDVIAASKHNFRNRFGRKV
jgi:RecB family exonuclease